MPGVSGRPRFGRRFLQEVSMTKATGLLLSLLLPAGALEQVPAATSPVATDVTSADIRAFIDALPRDAVSDLPIRVVDVTGDYRVGVFGVFRPKAVPGGANLHQVNTTEIYYMLRGTGTLVTGGTILDPKASSANSTTLQGSGIQGGVSRKVGPGDVVVIPGHTPHYWSELDSDLEYLIFRPDPDNRLRLN
jgi:mannose-6-phosphate isomerase-like protein (cupin superfamily)